MLRFGVKVGKFFEMEEDGKVMMVWVEEVTIMRFGGNEACFGSTSRPHLDSAKSIPTRTFRSTGVLPGTVSQPADSLRGSRLPWSVSHLPLEMLIRIWSVKEGTVTLVCVREHNNECVAEWH